MLLTEQKVERWVIQGLRLLYHLLEGKKARGLVLIRHHLPHRKLFHRALLYLL